MKNEIRFLLCFLAISSMGVACKKQISKNPSTPPADSSLVNLSHLNYLYVPVTFPDGTNAAGVYVYANAPNYDLTPATGEGYTCVDDVSRAALVYLRSSEFSTDTSIQSKAFKLISFLLEMQSSNGYFYNFLLTGNQINTNGATSINNPEWWSWRTLQTLAEGSPLVKSINPQLSAKMDNAVSKLIAAMKTDVVNLPQTTTVVSGITIPQWLPAGSGTDQSSTLILGLIPYCMRTGDTTMSAYIKKLADGIMLMQQGDSTHFPYDAFLSWENTWHAYGNEQAYALLKAGVFFNNANYTDAALLEINNLYPWLLQNGFQTSFVVSNTGNGVQLTSELSYAQIAYGITPMVFAAVEAYKETGQEKYADIAGHIAAWFLGDNAAQQNMYSVSSGICYDGLSSPTSINLNSGAESTIEALFTMEMVEENPTVKTALDMYKK
ncbi:MAG TPA: hypothetical protein VMU83_22275 [Hanamia sp.]|nr:hypothetical protein [Hanamia sp.]